MQPVKTFGLVTEGRPNPPVYSGCRSPTPARNNRRSTFRRVLSSGSAEVASTVAISCRLNGLDEGESEMTPTHDQPRCPPS